MIWQDMLLMVGTLVCSAALVPSVFSKSKPALATSVMTGITLYLFCVSYFTLGLWYAFAATLVTASVWVVLAVQKLRRKK